MSDKTQPEIPAKPIVLPEGRKVRVTLAHESGTFVGTKIETRFILDNGAEWSGYWEEKISGYEVLESEIPALKMTVAEALQFPDTTLANGLRDMIDGDRLTQAMIPDDWQWLVVVLGVEPPAPQPKESQLHRDTRELLEDIDRRDAAIRCGDWDGKKCPKCGCGTLKDSDGKRWCSFIGCDWKARESDA